MSPVRTKGGITGSTGSIDEGRASGHDTDPQQDQHPEPGALSKNQMDQIRDNPPYGSMGFSGIPQ